MNNNLFNNKEYNDSFNKNNNPSLFSAEEGYLKGNMFSNLYDEYSNYKPAILKASNDKDRLYLELMKIGFLKHELNLYLDLHPNDTSMLTLFNDYRERENILVNKYEEMYGAINLNSNILNDGPFNWVQSNWPWLLEENNYV